MIVFLSISTYIYNLIMVYALFACISAAMMSPIESFTDRKGDRFRFHLQASYIPFLRAANVKGCGGQSQNTGFPSVHSSCKSQNVKISGIHSNRKSRTPITSDSHVLLLLEYQYYQTLKTTGFRTSGTQIFILPDPEHPTFPYSRTSEVPASRTSVLETTVLFDSRVQFSVVPDSVSEKFRMPGVGVWRYSNPVFQ